MKLSIVIPVYNTPKTLLNECLDSIRLNLLNKCINQDDIEIIIVNDGSNYEDTLEYLSSLENVIILHQENKGQASAKNTGVRYAKGEYIFPLDSDDLVSDFISLYIDEITSNDKYDLLFGDLHVFGDLDYVYKLDDILKLEYFLDDKFIPSCSIYKRSLWEKLSGYDESFVTSEEYDFYCRAISIGASIKHMEKPNYYWRVINDGKSSAQRNAHLFKEYQYRSRDKISVNNIDKMDINDYLVKSFKKIRSDFSHYVFLFFFLSCTTLLED